MNDAPMQALGQEFLVRRRLVLGTGLLLAGCTEPYRIPGAPLPVASLVARGPVEVVRDGRVEVGHDGMALYRGDTLHTGAASHALCRFDDGNQVWLDHDTRVRLGSVFTFFGRVFAAVTGIFEIDSEFVAASSEGTEYTVSIGRSAPGFSVAVKSGAVLCRTRRGRWRPVRLVAGQRLTGTGIEPPSADQLDPDEHAGEFGWVPARSPIPRLRFREPTRRREPAPPRSPSAPTPDAPTPPSAPTRPPGSTAPGSVSPMPRHPGSRGTVIQRPATSSPRDPR